MLWLLIILLLPFISHQSFFRPYQHQEQNFFALKKPLVLPGRIPLPQPIMLTNQIQTGQFSLPATPMQRSVQQNQHAFLPNLPPHLQGSLLIPPKKGPMPIHHQFPPFHVFTTPFSAQKVAIPSGSSQQMSPNKNVMAPPNGLQWTGEFNNNFIPPPNHFVPSNQKLKSTGGNAVLDSFQPVMVTARTTLPVTSEGNRFYNETVTASFILPPVDVTKSMTLDENAEVNKNDSRLILSREKEDPWKPIDVKKKEFKDGSMHFVLSHVNTSSNEELENLPHSEALVGRLPNFNPNQYRRGDPRDKPSKLESIKRGIYGILFGRKDPPHPPERYYPPHPHLKLNLEPQPVPSRWQSMENELKLLTEGTKNDRNDRINCKMFTNDVCLEVNDYPFDLIMEDLMRDTRRVNDMHVDVPDQEKYELMDGISFDEEKTYNYEHYYGNQRNSHSHRDYGQEGGNICPSEVLYARPKRGRKLNGEWKFIVNVPQFPQTIRMERCLKPMAKCSYVGPHLDSQCSQLHTLQRMLTWDPQRRLHIEMLTFPSACSCYLNPITDQLMTNDTTPTSNDVANHWPQDTVEQDKIMHSEDVTTDNTGNRRRKFTGNQGLLGPYTRTLKKYTRANTPERPHTNFGRPLVSEKSYSPSNDEFVVRKINYNQHPMMDYIKPWM